MNHTVANREQVCMSLVLSKDPIQALTLGTIILNSLLSVVGVVQNSIIIWTVFKTSELHRPPFVLLGCLAVTDLLTGIIAQPSFVAFGIARYYHLWQLVCLTKTLATVLSVGLSGVSLGTLAVMNVDRFLALHYHLRYNELVTLSRVLITYVLLWSIMTLVTLPYFFDKPRQ